MEAKFYFLFIVTHIPIHCLNVFFLLYTYIDKILVLSCCSNLEEPFVFLIFLSFLTYVTVPFISVGILPVTVHFICIAKSAHCIYFYFVYLDRLGIKKNSSCAKILNMHSHKLTFLPTKYCFLK